MVGSIPMVLSWRPIVHLCVIKLVIGFTPIHCYVDLPSYSLAATDDCV